METASYTVEPEAAPEAVPVHETAPEAVSEPETASQTPAEQSVPEAAPPPAESAAATAVPEAAPEQGTAALPEWPVPAPAAPPVKKSRLPLILGICAGAAALIAGVALLIHFLRPAKTADIPVPDRPEASSPASLPAADENIPALSEGERFYTGTTSGDGLGSITVSFVLAADHSAIHDVKVEVTDFSGSSGSVSINASHITQTMSGSYPIDYDGDNQGMTLGKNEVEKLRFREDGGADLRMTYVFEQIGIGSSPSVTIPVPGLVFDMRSTAAGEAETAAAAAAPQDGVWQWDDMTFTLDRVTEDLGDWGSQLRAPDGKWVMAVFTITDGQIPVSRLEELVVDQGNIRLGDAAPVTMTAQGISIVENSAWAMGTINVFFELPADREATAADITVNEDIAPAEDAGESEAQETAAETEPAEETAASMYDEPFSLDRLRNWNDEALAEARGVTGLRDFQPADPQPLFYIVSAEEIIDPVTGEISQGGRDANYHREKPISTQDLLERSGRIRDSDFILTDDPDLATYALILDFSYTRSTGTFTFSDDTTAPQYHGSLIATLRNLVTGESIQTEELVSRATYVGEQVYTDMLANARGKQLYGGAPQISADDFPGLRSFVAANDLIAASDAPEDDSITVNFPAALMEDGGTPDMLVGQDNYTDMVFLDDGSCNVTMTVAQQQAALKVIAAEADEFISLLFEDMDCERSDDFTSFRLTSEAMDDEAELEFMAEFLGIYGKIYGIVDLRPDAEILVEFVDEDSGEVYYSQTITEIDTSLL